MEVCITGDGGRLSRSETPEDETVRRTLGGLPDDVLVQHVLDGSADALAVMYRRHGEMVASVAFHFLASEQDAQDVLHDVFVGLPEALRKYREQGRFQQWLKRVAVRTSLMRLRTRRRRREEHFSKAERSISSTSSDIARVPDLVALRRAMNDLSDEQRSVLILKQLEGYSHAEIGQLLGISEGASAARLHRALRRLWKVLGDPPPKDGP